MAKAITRLPRTRLLFKMWAISPAPIKCRVNEEARSLHTYAKAENARSAALHKSSPTGTGDERVRISDDLRDRSADLAERIVRGPITRDDLATLAVAYIATNDAATAFMLAGTIAKAAGCKLARGDTASGFRAILPKVRP